VVANDLQVSANPRGLLPALELRCENWLRGQFPLPRKTGRTQLRPARRFGCEATAEHQGRLLITTNN